MLRPPSLSFRDTHASPPLLGELATQRGGRARLAREGEIIV